jgi:hypothetical protein
MVCLDKSEFPTKSAHFLFFFTQECANKAQKPSQDLPVQWGWVHGKGDSNPEPSF